MGVSGCALRPAETRGSSGVSARTKAQAIFRRSAKPDNPPCCDSRQGARKQECNRESPAALQPAQSVAVAFAGRQVAPDKFDETEDGAYHPAFSVRPGFGDAYHVGPPKQRHRCLQRGACRFVWRRAVGTSAQRGVSEGRTAETHTNFTGHRRRYSAESRAMAA